jgi:hypothetical protein
MQASEPSDLTRVERDVPRRATIYFGIALLSMAATTLAASVFLRHLASILPTTADPRFFAHYSAGASMPFPVIMDHDAGFTFVGVFVAFAVLLALESLWAARSLRDVGVRAPLALFIGLVAVLLIMLGFSTTFSVDAYAYAAFGRLLGVHGLNPYVHRLSGGSTLGDPTLAQIASLTGTPLPDENYGPLWTMLSAGLAMLTRNGELAVAIIAQRAAGACALVIAAFGVHRLLRDVPSGERERRTALFAMHPLALYESAAAGHNDMLMIAPAVWAFALVDGVPWVAGVLIGAAIAVKYVALVALPFVAIRAHRARGLAGSATCVALALAVPMLLFVPLWPGWQALGVLFNLGTTLIVSLQWLVDTWLPSFGERAIGVACAIVFFFIFAYSIWRYASDRCNDHVFRSWSALLWASPLLNPWYVQWLLPAAAATGRWARYAWWFGLFVMLRYVEDAPRFPATQSELSLRIALLEVATVVILVAPILLSRLPALPLQGAIQGAQAVDA